MFQLKHYQLPHPGVIPGAPGYKKEVIPQGTKVWCIAYGTRIYWCAYLNEAQALKCLKGLEDTVYGRTKRPLDLKTLLAWNFARKIPSRIARVRLKADV